MRKILTLILLFSAIISYSQQVDPDFPIGGARWFEKAGNKVYMSGTFKFIGQYSGSVAMIDSNNIEVIKTFPKIHGRVYSIASDGNGGWIIGGDFTKVNNDSIKYLIRVRADHSLDTTWRPQPNTLIRSIAVVNNKVFIGGDFNNVSGQVREGLAVLDLPTGNLRSVNYNLTGGNSSIESMVVKENTVFMGGSFTTIGGKGRSGLAAVDAITEEVKLWNPGPNSIVRDIAYYDGKIYASGSFTLVGGQNRKYLACVDTLTGSLTPWDPQPDKLVHSILPYGGKVYLGGDFNKLGGIEKKRLAAVNITTGEPESWDPLIDTVYAKILSIVYIGNGNLAIGGDFLKVNDQVRYYAAMIDTLGYLKQWNPNPNGIIETISQDGSRILLGGNQSFVGVERRSLACYDIKTKNITSWNPPSTTSSMKQILGRKGDTLFVKYPEFKIGEAIRRSDIKAISLTTGEEYTWPAYIGAAASGFIYDFIVKGNFAYIFGLFDTLSGVPRKNLAILDLNTGLPTLFKVPVTGIRSIAVNDDFIFLAGPLVIEGIPKYGFATINLATQKISTWNTRTDYLDGFHDLELSGDTLYVGGSFNHNFYGANRKNAAAFNITTGELLPWNPNPDNRVLSIKANGSLVYLGGEFQNIGGATRAGFAVVDSKYGFVNEWNPLRYHNGWGSISNVVLQDGDLYLAGSFSSIDGVVGSSGQARITNIPSNSNYLSGKVYFDANFNCIYDEGDQPIPHWLVKVNQSYVSTNQFGNYHLSVGKGTFAVSQVIPSDKKFLVKQACPDFSTYNILFDSFERDSASINFANQISECSVVTVDLESNRRRRCFRNITTVKYCNEGIIQASNVKLKVVFPQYVIPLSASSNYLKPNDSVLIFDLGNLLPGQCGQINITDSVECVNGITGFTQCTQALISFDNPCTYNIPSWDKAELKLYGYCADGFNNFIIKNRGQGNMADSSIVHVMINDTLSYKQKFKLATEDSMIIKVPARGKTVRVEAFTTPNSPYGKSVMESIENCGLKQTPSEAGFTLHYPIRDQNPSEAISCLEIRDSYDPNAKVVIPYGKTMSNNIQPDADLEYTVHFQNTGSDTAYQVIIKDTLSGFVDIEKFKSGASSHPCIWKIMDNVVTWTFKNINLPHTAVNESASHGFVKFRIAQKSGNPNGTQIDNKAYIFFDYNLPIITNQTSNTVWDTVVYDLAKGTGIITEHGILTILRQSNNHYSIRVFPNPFKEQTGFQFNTSITSSLRLELLKSDGTRVDERIIDTGVNGSTTYTYINNSLSEGIYFYRLVSDKDEVIATGKVMVQF